MAGFLAILDAARSFSPDGAVGMSKRCTRFERNPRDFYRTPAEAVEPLLPHLISGATFIEPCAGAGDLTQHLQAAGHFCARQVDIEPLADEIERGDAFDITNPGLGVNYFITNPPWSRDILHPLIVRLSDMLPTWLLFDADWMHTKQAAPFQSRCRIIVSVGRVKWMAGSKRTGKDNCAWYLFHAPVEDERPMFWGR